MTRPSSWRARGEQVVFAPNHAEPESQLHAGEHVPFSYGPHVCAHTTPVETGSLARLFHQPAPKRLPNSREHVLVSRSLDGSRESKSNGVTATQPREPTQAATGARAGAPARASWPRCRARARSTGERCRARGDGLRGLCKNHTGMTLGGWREPRPIFEVRLTPKGIWIAPNRPARTWRKPSWPAHVSWSTAVRLVTSGRVTRGLLHLSSGSAFLSEIKRCRVSVIAEGPATALVRRFRFQVLDIGASKQAAKRRGTGKDK